MRKAPPELPARDRSVTTSRVTTEELPPARGPHAVCNSKTSGTHSGVLVVLQTGGEAGGLVVRSHERTPAPVQIIVLVPWSEPSQRLGPAGLLSLR